MHSYLRRMLILLAFIGIGGLLLVARPLRADGSGEGVPHAGARPQGFATPGSDASFDRRLPPVLPGEEVSDGKNRMKMWSTSGPVPVAPAPEPWKQSIEERNGVLGSGVGVIVDQRNDRRR